MRGWQGRAARPPQGRAARSRRREGQVRRAAQVDPRLAGARRRQCRRLPGLPGFGAKSAAALLTRYGHIEQIPDDGRLWDVPGLRGVDRLASTLVAGRDVVALFKVLATLRTDAKVGKVDDWQWKKPKRSFAEWCDRFDSRRLLQRAEALAKARAS